jgi:hypothetical protein
MDRRTILIPLLIFMALVVVGSAGAQTIGPIEARLIVPEGNFTVGDPIELTLAVSHPAGYQVIMPELATEWGAFVVQSQSPPVTVEQDDGTEITSQIIDARVFTPGQLETPPLTITVTDGTGQVSEVVAPSVPVNIASVLVEGDAELRDIKPQAELPYLNLLPWVVAGLVIALVGAMIYLIIRRTRTRRLLAAIDNRLPHEVALDELDRIEGLALPDKGQFKQHYSLVSDCMRVYMENRFEVPMMERTTAEIQASLKEADLQPGLSGQVMSLLDISDLVKFSKYTPEVSSAYALLTSARQIVQATLPIAPTDELNGPSKVTGNTNLSAGPNISANGGHRQKEVQA